MIHYGTFNDDDPDEYCCFVHEDRLHFVLTVDGYVNDWSHSYQCSFDQVDLDAWEPTGAALPKEILMNNAWESMTND